MPFLLLSERETPTEQNIGLYAKHAYFLAWDLSRAHAPRLIALFSSRYFYLAYAVLFGLTEMDYALLLSER